MFCETVGDMQLRYFVQELNDGNAFGVSVAQKKTENRFEAAFYVYCCDNAARLKSVLQQKVTDALQQGYDALFETHKKWWAEYNGKSSVTVPDVYIQNRYNMGNYLLGAASRRGCYPMPLQGLWTACDDKFLPL